MATPAFVYAFDNLGHTRFVELCGLLLGGRYKGFLLTGPGPDGGVDAETAPVLGELRPESSAVVVDWVLQPSGLIVFQFKHVVAARVGQAASRRALLSSYRSTKSTPSEVRKPGITTRQPDAYVLVTNVEVNSEFRISFRDQCRKENPDINVYQVIGLDDLEAWVTMDRQLRAQFFPTLFSAPRFDLRVKLDVGFLTTVARDGTISNQHDEILVVIVQNVGEATSYLDKILFKTLVGGTPSYLLPMPSAPGEIDPRGNPKFGLPLEPGRCTQFHYYFDMFRDKAREEDYFLIEAMVWDQIGNLYTAEVSDEIREAIFAVNQDG